MVKLRENVLFSLLTLFSSSSLSVLVFVILPDVFSVQVWSIIKDIIEKQEDLASYAQCQFFMLELGTEPSTGIT